MNTFANIHPGEILLEEFLQPLGISQNALARAAAWQGCSAAVVIG